MTKIELAKMIGLEMEVGGNVSIWEVKDLLSMNYMTIEREFSGGITVEVNSLDYHIDRLDICEDTIQESPDRCVADVENFLWTLAAAQYLERVHNAAMTIKL